MALVLVVAGVIPVTGVTGVTGATAVIVVIAVTGVTVVTVVTGVTGVTAVTGVGLVRQLGPRQLARRMILLRMLGVARLRRRLLVGDVPSHRVFLARRHQRDDQWMWRMRQPSGVRVSSIVSTPWESMSRSCQRPVLWLRAV